MEEISVEVDTEIVGKWFCKCCDHNAGTKGNYQRHLESSKHIKKEMGEREPEKESSTIFKKRLMRENKDLREAHLQEVSWLKEKHKDEMENMHRIIREKDLSFDNMYKILNDKIEYLMKEVKELRQENMELRKENMELRQENKEMRELLSQHNIIYVKAEAKANTNC